MPRSGDDLYGFAVRLKEGERLIANDPKTRAADKKPILSILGHIKAKEVGIGRQAKYAFMLGHGSSQRKRVPERRSQSLGSFSKRVCGLQFL